LLSHHHVNKNRQGLIIRDLFVMYFLRAVSVVVALLTMPNVQSLRMASNSFNAAQEEHMVRAWWDKWWASDHNPDHKLMSSVLQASPEDEAKEWWDNDASDAFQHTDEKYVKQTARAWQKFLIRFDWKGKKVLDYGIGGGYLGKALFEDHGISHYTGVDISHKALDVAETTLAKYNTNDHIKLVLTPVQFSEISPDIFVSQQVIQHFPSVDYFKDFLENVDKSNANQVMLQFRASRNGTTYSTDAYSKGGQEDVIFALLADKDFIAQHLKNYKFVWSDTNPMCCNTIGVYTGWNRK